MNNESHPVGSSIRDRVSAIADDEIDIGALLHTVWRGKLWIALAVFICIVLGGVYAFRLAVPSYKADSVVMLENRQENVANLESVMSGLSGDQATINTEVEVLRGRGLIEKLVAKLELTSDPEFNPDLKPEPVFSVGKSISWVRGLVSDAEPTKIERTEQQILDEAIDLVLSKISISNVRQSYVFRISATTENAKKSADIANSLAELYVLDQLEVKFQATEQATEWLTERVSELQITLEDAEAAVKEFSTGTNLVSPETLVGLNRQLKELRDRRQDAEASAKAAAEMHAKLVKVADSGDLLAMSAAAADRTLSRTFDMINAGNEGARDSFDARFALILDRAATDRNRAEAQQQALKQSIIDIEAQIQGQSAELVVLQQLQREAEASRLIYEYFLGRLKETSVQQGIQQADSRILSSAVVPLRAAAPRKGRILALAAVLGFFLGAALVLLREMRQTGIRTAEELERLSGTTVLGQIPVIPARRRSNVVQYLVDKPNSAAAEAIRNLRTSILLSNIDNPPKVIMSTSSLPGEGKTTQSFALAQNLSGLGNKVLLIEGDIRRRVFSEYFDIKEKRGLLSVLAGESELQDVVTHLDQLGVDVIIGEKSTTNAADVFSSKKFAAFLKKAREQYDAIIIDTPPVLVVPDARVIGQSVDAIIYSVKWDSTSRMQVRAGLHAFETVNLRVTGLVLSQISAKGMKRYGYGGDYGAYGAYGSKYYHN